MAEDMEKTMPFIMKALIIAIMAIIVVILAAGISYFVASKAVGNAKSGSVTEKEEGKVSGEEKKKVEIGTIVPLGEYTINLKNDETKYLLCEINLEVENTKNAEKDIKELEEKKAVMQDRINTILRNKTLEEFNADKNLAGLKKEMVASVNGIFEKIKIKNVYFIKWIVQ